MDNQTDVTSPQEDQPRKSHSLEPEIEPDILPDLVRNPERAHRVLREDDAAREELERKVTDEAAEISRLTTRQTKSHLLEERGYKGL